MSVFNVHAALTGLAEATKAVLNVRLAVEGSLKLRSDLQIDRVRQELRTVYTYQSGILGSLEAVIETNGKKSSELNKLRAALRDTQETFDSAAAFLNSREVEKNLRLDLTSLDQLRGGVFTKAQLRKGLLGMLEGRPRLTPSEVVEMIKIKAMLTDLNKAIGDLEDRLAKVGLMTQAD